MKSRDHIKMKLYFGENIYKGYIAAATSHILDMTFAVSHPKARLLLVAELMQGSEGSSSSSAVIIGLSALRGGPDSSGWSPPHPCKIK